MIEVTCDGLNVAHTVDGDRLQLHEVPLKGRVVKVTYPYVGARSGKSRLVSSPVFACGYSFVHKNMYSAIRIALTRRHG